LVAGCATARAVCPDWVHRCARLRLPGFRLFAWRRPGTGTARESRSALCRICL